MPAQSVSIHQESDPTKVAIGPITHFLLVKELVIRDAECGVQSDEHSDDDQRDQNVRSDVREQESDQGDQGERSQHEAVVDGAAEEHHRLVAEEVEEEPGDEDGKEHGHGDGLPEEAAEEDQEGDESIVDGRGSRRGCGGHGPQRRGSRKGLRKRRGQRARARAAGWQPGPCRAPWRGRTPQQRGNRRRRGPAERAAPPPPRWRWAWRRSPAKGEKLTTWFRASEVLCATLTLDLKWRSHFEQRNGLSLS
ncbi:hypothetical protein BHM03_00014350 [Ensete ventricosum]|nr:hypothetical protein BHM03_00014350 [Ensete ventricosum]